MRPWKPDEEATSRAEGDILQPVESFELVREEKDEEAQTSTVVESTPLIAQDAASQASLTVEAAKPEDLAANPIEWMASVSPPPAEEAPEAAADWSAADIETPEDDKAGALESDDLETASGPVVPESSAEVVAPASVPGPTLDLSPTPAQPSIKPPAQSADDTARSIPKQDWAELTTDLKTKSFQPAGEKPTPSAVPVAQAPAATAPNIESAPINSAPPVSKPLTQSVEDTAHSIPKQDWADLAASLLPKPIEPVAEKSKLAPTPAAQAPDLPDANAQPAAASEPQVASASTGNAQPASANSAAPASPDPALVEAVVQRVLEKMRPQVVDIITKEFLRPVVQALVHREITKH